MSNDFIDNDSIFGFEDELIEIPKDKLSAKPIPAQKAHQLIKDQLIDEGNARQNLATFCQTYMEDEAVSLMKETLEKNAIDKSEYPRCAEIEQRCIDIIANLWNSNNNHFGTSTIGSSEACMLGGLAMNLNWQDDAKKNNIDLTKQRPNIIISSGYQICWEKFCIYWDIEMRTIPISESCMSIDTSKVLENIDEYTIGIVGILGITYTGQYDDIKELNNIVQKYNDNSSNKVYIHIDAASGGLYAPFITPDLEWDFRLENIISINTSGHKYGLVYPGIGWIIWKDLKFIPERLIFSVDYLGGKTPTMSINFSKSASPIIGQYYNFLRLGVIGYQSIHQKTKDVASYITSEIEKTKLFKIYSDNHSLPVVCYKMKKDNTRNWNLYDLSNQLQTKGWQVPTYPLPKNLENVIVQRIVCRSDFAFNMAQEFIQDFNDAIKFLDDKNKCDNITISGFSH